MFSFSVDLKKELYFDVVVVGGGTSGTFAAICAAKCGAKTAVIEKTSMLGGTITNGAVNAPGLFFAWGKQIIDGPCYQAILKTCSLGGGKIPDISAETKYYWQEQIRIDVFLYLTVIEKMLQESNVSVLYHASVAQCLPEEDGIALIVLEKEGLSVYHAKRVIDCTGDANIVQMMGYDVEISKTTQPASLINRLSGYCYEDLQEEVVLSKCQEAIDQGLLSKADFQGKSPLSSLKGYKLYFQIPSEVSFTSQGKTKIEMDARAALLRITTVLKTIPGLENLTVSSIATECGIRESVRVVGNTKMTVENYLSGFRYPDAVSYCFYPIDRHTAEGKYHRLLEKGVIPTIPIGALIPQGSTCLMVAGRCASGDADANSGYRVQASCMSMGQVAGVTTALSVKHKVDVGKVDLEEIKGKLKELGAIVP